MHVDARRANRAGMENEGERDMRKWNRAKALVIGGLVVAMAAVAVTSAAGNRGNTAGAPGRAEALYVTDLRDDRRLVGLAANVFVGRVVAQQGTVLLDEFPESQFQVEVLENIKGTLSGKVVVNQQGGKDGDRLILVDGDPLLRNGQTYLFVTRPFPAKGWHTLVPHYGDIPIADAQQRTSLVARFAKATREQIPYVPD
jgi:hypothetical protein